MTDSKYDGRTARGSNEVAGRRSIGARRMYLGVYSDLRYFQAFQASAKHSHRGDSHGAAATDLAHA
jgi:hypothetical protein